MHCPRDKSSLRDKVVWKLIAKSCPDCNGIWIPYSELKTLYDEGLMAVPSQVYSKSEIIHEYDHWDSEINCIIDGNRMITYDIQNTHVDICPICKGLWLDDGEIKKYGRGKPIPIFLVTG